LFALVTTVAAGCATSQKRSLIYGDSITYEAQQQLKARGLEVHAFGGTAICDWLADMRRQAATRTVGTVYLEFVGNYFTPCVRTRPQVTAYRDDAWTAAGIWRASRVRVIWVRPPQPRSAVAPTPTPIPIPTPSGVPAPPSASPTQNPAQNPTPSSPPSTTPPPSAAPTETPSPTSAPTQSPSSDPSSDPSSGDPSVGTEAVTLPATTPAPATGPPGALKAAALLAQEFSILDQFDQVQSGMQAASRPDAYVDTSRLIAPNRVFTQYLPCRPGEPCNVLAPRGYDAARAADGLHLCPTQLKTVAGVVSTQCTVYSISAARFAEQVAAVR
jgi:hypothetical protein